MSHYLTTADPDVIGAIERNQRGMQDLRERACDWAETRGFDHVMMSRWGSQTYVSGLPGQPVGFGQWTQPKSGTSTPFRNNAAEWEILNSLAFMAEAIPGLPETVDSVTDAHTGQLYIMFPSPFVHDGSAWLSFAHRVEPADLAKIGDQWTECLASEFHAAREAVAL